MQFSKITSVFVAAICLVLVGCTDNGAITKSPNDDRAYRHLTLDNGMRVVLVSDQDTDKSAASLTVFRGSYHDPAGREGLVHFLEHMLFIGTEKYPEVDGYFTFIQSHGGGANAYTSSDHTNYFFDIQPEFFHEGLDRFAQFFISPNFDPAYVDREKNAVHSEYQLQIKDDGWRGFATQKALFNPEHPLANFNIGSLDTLSGDVHADLLDFFHNHYSANIMGLVVLTNEPLDDMETLVRQTFDPVENRQLEQIHPQAPLFKKGQLPGTLEYQLLKDNHELSIVFPIPSQMPHYRSKPINYILNLLGHEGQESLHRLLTEKGWITGLNAGQYDVDPNTSLVYLDLRLTEEGLAQTDAITAYVFDYIDILRESKLEAWRYEEQAAIAELGFRYKEEDSAMGTVRHLSPLLQYYPTADLLTAPYLMEAFEPALIKEFLSYLRRDNAAVVLASPSVQGRNIEKWFSVPYRLKDGISESGDTQHDFKLPASNPFLPESLAMLPEDDHPPQVTGAGQKAEIYLDTDLTFGVPRAVMHISLRNPGGLMSVSDVVHAQLYAALVRDDLTPLAYPALQAGLSYGVSSPPKGFRVTVNGYSDKQLVLLEEVLARLVNLQIDPERFRVLKAEQERNLANAGKDRPFQQAFARLADEIVSSSWTPEAQLNALRGVTPQQLAAWRDQKLAELSVQALLLGNLGAKDAAAVRKLLQQQLPLAQVSVAPPRNRLVKGSERVDIKVDHNDAAMLLYIQNDTTELKDRALSGLLVHLIRPAYFATLRTEEQLGYVVAARPAVFRHRGGIGFVVQSPVAGPDYLKARTTAFLDVQRKKLMDMPATELAENKEGLITSLTQKDSNLGERAWRYWNDLDLGITTFDSNQRLADAVAEVTQEELLERLDQVRAKADNAYLMIYTNGKFN